MYVRFFPALAFVRVSPHRSGWDVLTDVNKLSDHLHLMFFNDFMYLLCELEQGFCLDKY